MIEVIRYSSCKKQEWDEFVNRSDNYSFLFCRDYMDYHAERFKDYSLMVYDHGKLSFLLPCNISGNKICSHQGLTYGGAVLNKGTSFEKIELYFHNVINYLHGNKILLLNVKFQPHFYSTSKQEAFLYLLNELNDCNIRMSLGTHIYTDNYEFPKKCVRKGKIKDYKFKFSDDPSVVYKLIEECLCEIYKAKPVHSLEEIILLKRKFDQEIIVAELHHKETNQIHSGAILYKNKSVLKIQYFVTSDKGRKNRASDVLYYNIINEFKDEVEYIDLGTNMTKENEINYSLLQTKEKFGASIHPFFNFEISIKSQ